MRWKEKQSFGLPARNIKQLKRIGKLSVETDHIIDFAEIRMGDFEKSKTPLLSYSDNTSNINYQVVDEVHEIAKYYNLAIHLHYFMDGESKWQIANPKHRMILLNQFLGLEELYRKREIGKVIVVHPSFLPFYKNRAMSEKKSLTSNKIFFSVLDQIRQDEEHQTVIGLENMPERSRYCGIGYMPIHFKEMLIDTATVSLVVDSGHRRLTTLLPKKMGGGPKFSVSKYIGLGIPIAEYHLSGNNEENDQHQLANRKNVTGYDNYFNYFRRHRPPVLVEVNIDKHKNRPLKEYFFDLNQQSM